MANYEVYGGRVSKVVQPQWLRESWLDSLSDEVGRCIDGVLKAAVGQGCSRVLIQEEDW